MAKIPRPYIGAYAPCRNYIDLDAWQDDKTVLKNPHKGWYWHFIDNGYGRGVYRDTLEPGDYMEDFPGLNHLYLRFDWGDIEKEEGVLDWSYIDSIMDEWGAKDYRFSFRICTDEVGSEPESIKYATPKWVYDAGANKFDLPDGRIEPDFGDPIFLEKLENFMRAYGEKYNKDPRIEFIDIGTFGEWGEGHIFWGTNKMYPAEVIKKHILLHAKYFPDKYILLNDDMVGHRATLPEEDKQDIMEYAKTLGCGARDDSINVKMYCEPFGYDSIRSPKFFDQLNENAPVDIEFEHYYMVLSSPDREVFRSGLSFIEALRRTKATYAGFHGYPRPWLEQFPALTEYIANRLGYWFFVEGLRMTTLISGCQNVVEVYFKNRGYSRCYYDYDLKLRLINKETGEVHEYNAADADCRRWMPEETVKEAVKMNLFGVNPGTYTLELGLFEGARPIRFGMQQECYHDGWYMIADTEVI